MSLNTSVDVIRVPKARTSGKYLPIDISISILLRSTEKISSEPMGEKKTLKLLLY